MELIKNLARAAGAAAQCLGRKHQKTAVLNRLRTVVRCEERALQKEYLALGRYYYNALRDPENPVAEPHCKAIDEAEKRLDVALSHMQAMTSENCIGIIVAPGEDGDREEIDLSDVEYYDEEP